MFTMKCLRSLAGLLLLLAGIVSSSGQITVNGVVDKTVYNDTVTFTIVTQAGYTYSAFLNTNPAPVGVAVTVNQPDYYELRVTSTQTSSGAVTVQLVRFIVAASAREDTEWGLPPQVPWPQIPSASNEFAGAQLRLLAPQRFPAGYEIPVVAWVEDANGHAVRANGFVQAAGHPSFRVRRGVGSGFLAATNPAGSLAYAPTIQGLPGNKSITVEGSTSWTSVSGVLSGSVSWPDNSRIFVTTNVTVAAGATLTIGAGTIVRVNYRTDFTNDGAIVINGTRDQPVVFMPNSRALPWGGFMMRNGTGSITGSGVIFTGSGAVPNWFGTGGNPGSHRTEQALFFVANSQSVSITDGAAMFLAGQLGHAVNGGTFRFTHFLAQGTTSEGEFTGSSWVVNDSAFIECPDDSINFVNGDNDALYFVSGVQAITNTLIGWTKDDAVDCGGSGYGTLYFQSCWFESTFHEGNALSGYKNVYPKDSVYIGCGQGFEDGYNSPTGHLDHCLITDNQIGIRHGDNYPSIGNYDGSATASNCIVLWNHHDIFGYNWHTGGGWTQAIGQLSVQGNWITAVDTNYPNNFVWDPVADAAKLAPFGARSRVGVGLAAWPGQRSLSDFPNGIPVGLSIHCVNEVRVNYSVLGTDGTSRSGTIVFPAGRTRNYIPLPGSFSGVLRVALDSAVNADITGTSTLLFQNLAPPALTSKVLSPLGAAWKYLDDGSDQGISWRGTNFNDTTWSNGVARLGFGPDAAATTTIRRFLPGSTTVQITNFYFRRAILATNPTDFATIQFRYQRDDGCILYLNEAEMFRNNMPSGPVDYRTFATNTITPQSETLRFWTNSFAASLLRPGTNVIAVEVHQATATSSDIAWEMELQGVNPPPPVRVNIARLGGDAAVYWNDASFGLQEADQVDGPWRPAATSSPVGEPITGTRFFRLKNGP